MAPMFVVSHTALRTTTRRDFPHSSCHVGCCGAEHAARQRVAGERGEKLATAGVDRYVTATLDDVGGIAFDMARLAEQGYGQETLVESHVDDLRALGYHRAVFGMEAVAELVIGQTVVDGHSSGV